MEVVILRLGIPSLKTFRFDHKSSDKTIEKYTAQIAYRTRDAF